MTQYAGGFGSGSLNNVGLSNTQLTSTWGSGDFDSASLNSSGHQNVFARAESEPKHECITCAEEMDELVARGQTWSCECCGFLVGTQGKHEGCGFNNDGKVMCSLCYSGQCDCDSEDFDAETFGADYNYYSIAVDKPRGAEILDTLRNSDDATKAAALDYLIDNGYVHSEEIFDSAVANELGDYLGISPEDEEDEDEWDAETFDAEYVHPNQPTKGHATSSPIIWDSKKGQLIDPPMFTVWIGNDTEHFKTFEEALEFAKNDIEEDEEAQITISYYATLKDAETHSHSPHEYYTPVGPSETASGSEYVSHDAGFDIDSFMAEGDSYDYSPESYNHAQESPTDYDPTAVSFSAEYDGPSTLSSALSGARKTDKNGRHLTIIQRLVAKYGIEKGTRIYKHFGVKQKRASPKVRGKVRGTASGPRRYSEGRVGGAGRSQVYQKGDRTGSWTPSGGYTTSYANSGKAWYQERGYGTPVMGPVPDTALAGKAMGEKARGRYVNPAGIVGYPFVPAQQREQKRK
jgi:hypothetical protein